jgi:plastocyanin
MKRIILAATSVAALAVVGCGSSSSNTTSSKASGGGEAASTAAPTSSTPSAAGGSSTVSIAANPSGMLMFNSSSLTAKAGKVTIAFTNNAPEVHNFTLATASGSLVGATPTFSGGTKSLVVNLKPGTYTYYCSVPGHRMGGMQGKLVVS